MEIFFYLEIPATDTIDTLSFDISVVFQIFLGILLVFIPHFRKNNQDP